MSDADMLAAIINAIQTDENLIALIRAAVTNSLQTAITVQLQNAMTILGLPTS